MQLDKAVGPALSQRFISSEELVIKSLSVKLPADAREKCGNAKRRRRVALAAMKPGVRSYDVDKAQRDWRKKTGSQYVMWSTGHPVGYWAHDLGPSLGGFFSWEVQNPRARPTKTISVEETAVITENGAENLILPQEDLVLISSR